jgi:Helix-turn-helix domain
MNHHIITAAIETLTEAIVDGVSLRLGLRPLAKTVPNPETVDTLPPVGVLAHTPPPQAEYLDTRGAAALLGVSPKTLEKLRAKKEGPKFMTVGKAVRYRRSDLG